MVMKFTTAAAVTVSESLVGEVFNRPVALANEARKEAAIPAGHVGLIVNYRGHKQSKNGQGRKARGAGGTIVDLSSLSRVPAPELPDLIARLQELVAGMADAEASAYAMEAGSAGAE